MKIKKASKEKSVPAALMLANEYAKRIGVSEIIDKTVTWDKKQCNLAPSQLAMSIILSTFLSVRSPLCRIEQHFEGMDVEALLGKGVNCNDLTDDALGRMLDKIHSAGTSALFSKIALNAYSKFAIPMQNLHSDNTSVSLYGEYADCEVEEYDGLNITHGYSKDHRPDLKQIMVGSIVNEHGIPLYQQTLDGNTSDCIWNKDSVANLHQLLGEAIHNKIYVADSKAVTAPNLLCFTDQSKQLYLLSRCPDNFHKKLASRVKNKAFEVGEWQALGQLEVSSKHAYYYGQEFEEKLYLLDAERKLHVLPVRLLVYRSDEHKQRIAKRVEQELKALKKIKDDVEKRVFACLADAEMAAEELLKSQRKSLIEMTVSTTEQITEVIGRGRPSKQGRTPVMLSKWQITLNIHGQNQELVRQAEERSESFVLLTTAPADTLSLSDALWQYKGQHKVEILFHLLKQPAMVNAVFLKKPKRIEALILLLYISLLIRALMQYSARKEEKNMPVLPRIDFNGRILQKPTAEKLLLLIQPITIISRNNELEYLVTSELSLYRFQYVCQLLGISLGE